MEPIEQIILDLKSAGTVDAFATVGDRLHEWLAELNASCVGKQKLAETRSEIMMLHQRSTEKLFMYIKSVDTQLSTYRRTMGSMNDLVESMYFAFFIQIGVMIIALGLLLYFKLMNRRARRQLPALPAPPPAPTHPQPPQQFQCHIHSDTEGDDDDVDAQSLHALEKGLRHATQVYAHLVKALTVSKSEDTVRVEELSSRFKGLAGFTRASPVSLMNSVYGHM